MNACIRPYLGPIDFDRLRSTPLLGKWDTEVELKRQWSSAHRLCTYATAYGVITRVSIVLWLLSPSSRKLVHIAWTSTVYVTLLGNTL